MEFSVSFLSQIEERGNGEKRTREGNFQFLVPKPTLAVRYLLLLVTTVAVADAAFSPSLSLRCSLLYSLHTVAAASVVVAKC